jgi:hypothetical protein
MRRPSGAVPGTILSFALCCAASVSQQPAGQPGERVPASAFGPAVIETMAEVERRERDMVRDDRVRGVWNGEPGQWFVPPIDAKTPVHSGQKAIVNQWGDPRLGIAFGRVVELERAFVARHGDAPTDAVRAIGYRQGREVGRTEWFDLGAAPRAFAIGLDGIDRVVFEARPALGAAGWFALDDLAFRVEGGERDPVVLDFEALDWRTVLTETSYGGLVWETGTGLLDAARDLIRVVGAPRSPEGEKPLAVASGPPALGAGMTATPPRVSASFVGPRQGDPGGGWIPPDTCGAVGLDHFVSVVNANLSAFRRDTGQRVTNVGLDAFFAQTVGDPRIAFDPHGRRFVVLATDFSRTRTIFIGVSITSDPTGSWFKFSFRTDQGVDAGKWPDYPTRGVDARGVYTAAYMVGGTAGMTIWAIDKAPLYAATPSVGAVTAWRGLPWEGAIQPCFTYGDPGSEYLVSRRSSTVIRVRRIAPPLSAPTLVEVGSASVPSHASPPNAPALGSATAVSTIDHRPMNAVFRNGSVWMAHGVDDGGRAAVRWYEIGVSPLATRQVGTVSDPLWHYYYGSIAVDARGDVAIGMSGSHQGSWINAFATGRLAADPAGTTAPPILIKAGEGPYERVDGSGRNRWGDYSLTTVDPVDDLGFWTIQEYPRSNNSWETWIAQVGYDSFAYGTGWPGTLGVPS